MTEIILDGKEMINQARTHLYIRYKLNMPDHYGNNLDALWDVLSTYDKPIRLSIINKKDLIDCLGDYGNSIVKVFKDLEKENEKIEIEIKN